MLHLKVDAFANCLTLTPVCPFFVEEKTQLELLLIIKLYSVIQSVTIKTQIQTIAVNGGVQPASTNTTSLLEIHRDITN